MAGRPKKEFDIKTFEDLVGLGCTQEEICWFFRSSDGRCANIDTLSRWCKRTFKMNFQEYYRQNGGMAMKIALRRNQIKLSAKSAAMAIFLGKNYLGQTDHTEVVDMAPIERLDDILNSIKGVAEDAGKPENI